LVWAPLKRALLARVDPSVIHEPTPARPIDRPGIPAAIGRRTTATSTTAQQISSQDPTVRICEGAPVTSLPEWVSSGSVPIADDLSVLESALHSGRTEAAERGYLSAPAIVETEEVMWAADASKEGGRLVTAAEAAAAGTEFRPDRLRYRMVWPAEHS
jgi:hypothetical protein